MAARGKKQSPFIGRRVPLVDNGVPILYPRYAEVSEILAATNGKRAAEGMADGEKQAKKKKEEAEPQQEQANGSTASAAQLEDEQARRKREKREKREQRNKAKQQQQADNNDAGTATAALQAGNGAQQQSNSAAAGSDERQADQQQTEQQQQQQQQQQQEVALEKGSGRSNADEAAQIRSVLGFAGSVAKPTQFGFGFSVEERVEAETKAKLDRLIAQDATPDGCVPRRVYAGGMPYAWDEAAVRDYWSYCGEVEAADLLVFPDSGRFRGIAFVTFTSQQGYEAALACDGEELEGHTLKVQKCKAAAQMKAMDELSRAQQRQQHQHQQSDQQQQPGQPGQAAGGTAGKHKRGAAAASKTDGYNVAYVGNVAFEATPENLMDLFKPYGATKVRLHTDRETGKSKGFAHVHFETEEGLDRAMQLDGHQLLRRYLKVGYAQPKKAE